MKKKSFISVVLEKLAFEFNIKKGLSTEAGVNDHLKKAEKYNNQKYSLPLMVTKCAFTNYVVEGVQCYKITPKHAKSHKHILYFHGGAYIDNPMLFHWLFLDKIANKLGICITVPIYPKIPYATYKECYEKCTVIYKLLKANYGDNNIILMGDSAGAGFCVGLTESFINEKISLPRKLVLISPWVDVSMSTKISKEKEDKDFMLSVYGLKIFGKLWAGNSSTKNKKVSPLYGKLQGLPETLIVAGENEILIDDIMKFITKLEKNECKLTCYIKHDQGHVFPLYPLPEAKSGIKKICDFISRR